MSTNLILTPAQAATYDENQAPQFYAALIICTIVVVLLLGLRIWAQSITQKLSTPDMYLILVAFVWLIGLNASNFVALNLGGGGKHTIRVLIEANEDPEILIIYFKATYWVSVLLTPAFTFVKLSMLAFFRRVFSTQHRLFRIAWWILLTLNICYLIAVTFELIFQCWPIPWFWEREYEVYEVLTGRPSPIELHPGVCMPQTLHTAAPLISGLILDTALLLLPLIPIWNLQMDRTRKIGIFLTLSIGIFAIVLDGIRIYYDYQVSNGLDTQWTNMPLLLWCSIQVSAGFVCACIPACAPLLRSRLRHRSTSQHYQPRTKKSGTHKSVRSTDVALKSMLNPHTWTQDGPYRLGPEGDDIEPTSTIVTSSANTPMAHRDSNTDDEFDFASSQKILVTHDIEVQRSQI